jgi:thiol:disulfide interchange protein DsbD
VLTGILAFIAKTQSASLGAAAMAAFSVGLGFPFFLVGTFAAQLPKSGPWMVHVKSVLGIVLLVVALYFISLHVSALGAWVEPSVVLYGAGIAAGVLGVLLGAIHRDFAEPGARNRLSKGVGTLLVTAAVFTLVLAVIKPGRTLSWEPLDVGVARSQAQAEGRPLLVDFTASWCLSCKELDKQTFSDPQVEKEAGRFLAVKVDATDDEDPKVERALAEFQVRGLPTVILYDSAGKEAQRFNDFVAAGPFYEALQRVD